MAHDERLLAGGRDARRLRPVTLDDAALFEAQHTDPRMMAHLGGPISVDAALATLRRQAIETKNEDTWAFVIVTKDGRDAGSVVLWKHDGEDPLSEIGWMVLPAFQGRGLGKWAVREVLDRAHADGRWGAIHAYPPVTNDASNAMCRSAGFTFVDTADFVYAGRTLRCNHWCLDP